MARHDDDYRNTDRLTWLFKALEINYFRNSIVHNRIVPIRMKAIVDDG